jgi:predicted nuclease of predicted toxin-antitoxin system
MKFLIDEDISPNVAIVLCEKLLVDAVAVRDRGLLGVSDRKVLEYAFNEDRIIVTANIKDFEKFSQAVEVHAGIVFVQEGDLLRKEQRKVCLEAVIFIQREFAAGRDMINQALYISIDGTKKLKLTDS